MSSLSLMKMTPLHNKRKKTSWQMINLRLKRSLSLKMRN